MRSRVRCELSVIFGLQRKLHGSSAVGSKRPDGCRRYPEDPGSVLAPVVKEIQEHERGALTLWKLSNRADHFVAKVDSGEGVLEPAWGQGPFRGECEPPEPPARPHPVQHSMVFPCAPWTRRPLLSWRFSPRIVHPGCLGRQVVARRPAE